MEIEREIEVPETADEVWDALTDPERLEEPGGQITAMYPELVKPGATGIALWAGARGTARLRARAGAAGVPLALFAPGLLRAPPRGGAPPLAPSQERAA